MKKDFLDSIKERMDGYESPVPEGLWDEIEASVFTGGKEKRAPFMPWVWRVAAAAAVVALGIFAGVRLTDKAPESILTADSQEGRDSLTIIKPSSSADIEGAPVASETLLADAFQPSAVAGPSRTAATPSVAEPAETPEPTPVAEPIPVPEPAEAVEAVGEPESPKTAEAFQTTHDGEDWSGYSDASQDGGRRTAGISSAGLSLSSTTSEFEDVTTVDTRMFYLGAAPDSKLDPVYELVRTTTSSRMSDKYAAANINKTETDPVTRDEEHRRPVRASLTFLYPINDVFGIESGVSYSILRSSFATSSGTRLSDVSQSLGFLGIPLNLKAGIVDRDWFQFYLSGGGMLEKCVNASTKTTVTNGDVVEGKDIRKKLSVDPLFWSVNAAAGFQFNLADHIGIYAEPGASYHFANNSNVRSVYSERPFDFVLTFGARYSFK